MLRYLSLLSVAVIAATPAQSAVPATPLTVLADDGAHYRYTTALLPGDRIAIRGERTETHEPFEMLIDAHGSVTGLFGYQPVEFNISMARRNSVIEGLRQEATSATTATAIEASLH